MTSTETDEPVSAICKGNTSETAPVNTGVSLHNPTSVVPPVSPPVNSALPPNLTEVLLPLACDSSNSGNPTSCDMLSSNNQSVSYNSKTCLPKSDVHVLQSVPVVDVHSTPSKLNEPVIHLPVEMHTTMPQPLETDQIQTSCELTLSRKELSERDSVFPNKSDTGDLSDRVYIHQQLAGQVAGSTSHQLSQGNLNALDGTVGAGLIQPKVEIKIEDTSLQENDVKAHVDQSVSAMKLEPEELMVQDEPMSTRLRTPRGSTEHKNEDTSSEIGDQPDNLVTKTLRGKRNIAERPESPSLRVGRSQRIRRKTPTPSEELDTKSDTTDRSESPKPTTRPQRTKRKLLEDGEFHELIVPNKRTRTLTDDSMGSSKTGYSLDSSEDELNLGELSSSKIRTSLKHKLVNAKCDDIENSDRVSPRNRRPTPKMEAAEMKRSGRQSRSNSRGASDGTPMEEGQDNGVKGKQTRAGSRETRKPSDEAEKNQPMNTRRYTERSKTKEKSPPRGELLVQ
jgi:hypothetical protein